MFLPKNLYSDRHLFYLLLVEVSVEASFSAVHPSFLGVCLCNIIEGEKIQLYQFAQICFGNLVAGIVTCLSAVGAVFFYIVCLGG